jgi:hypothetical protein
MNYRLLPSALIALAVVLISGSLIAAGPPDTGILINYGPTPLAMPYNGANGNAVVAAKQVAVSSLGNNFNGAMRGDTSAMTGGAYNSTTQSAFFGMNTQGLMYTQGQIGGFWGFETNFGKGNAFFGNGVETCYGGGEVGLPSSTPECVGSGEFDAFQGTLVWSATVTGSPGAGATTINFTSPTNASALGARTILNLDHVTGGTGTISAFTQCNQGSGGVCPGTCPGGTGSACTVVTFAGASINTTAGLQWYFKTTPNQNDYYNPSCVGDDILFANGGGPSVPKCIGHWYQVATVNSANKITLYGSFDQENLGTWISTANYVMVEGIEATDVSQTANTITLPSNGMTWSNGDFIYSPPEHYMVMSGLNLIFSKQYNTGFESAPSRGIFIDNPGPALMDAAIDIEGGSAGAGGYRTGIIFNNLNIRSSVPGGSGELANFTLGNYFQSDVNYLILSGGNGAQTPATDVIALGPNGGSTQYGDAVTSSMKFDGTDVNIAKGVYNDGGGLKHSRITTGSVGPSGFVAVDVPWTTTFLNNSYTPSCSVIDASGNLTVAQLSALLATKVTVDIKNGDASNPHTGTISCIAIHD